MTSIVKLPEDFIKQTDSINISIYTSHISLNRSRVEFSQNMLCLLMKGKKEISHTNFNKQIDDSQCFLLQSGKTVMVDRAKNNQYQSILLFFSNDFLIEFCLTNKINLEGSISKYIADIFVFKKDNFILNYAHSLLIVDSEYLNNVEFKKIKLNEIFNYLLLTQPDRLINFIFSCLQNNEQTSFRKIIEQHKYINITMKELSFLCNMSISTFKRKFQEIYSISPQRYFIDSKMQKACRLLLNQTSVSDISEELGYKNLPAFSREFKKHFGVSPKDYLKKS